MRNKPRIRDTTTDFPAKWRLRNRRRNCILMMCLYPDLGSASYWLKQNSSPCTTNHSTNQIWVVTSHRYRISAAVSQTSFRGEPVVASRNVGCSIKLKTYAKLWCISLTCLRILVVSSTPVYLSWVWTFSWSNLPGIICSFGRMHL